VRSDDEVLANLLVRWDELREQGREVGPEELAPDHPHLRPELARRIAALRAMDWIDRTAGPVEVAACDAEGGPAPGPRRLGGRYRLDRLIAEGGSGQVWEGFDEELQRAVAVKVQRPTRLSTRPPVDFLAEGRRVARLEHPGIVPVYDVGQDGGRYYIVSKLVAGESVADRLRHRSRFDPATAARIAADVARGLEVAHRQGIVHRDIKPGNLLLDTSDRPYLTDFGIAATAPELSSASPAGTLAYMAPEQLAGDAGRPDHRADIYGLGVVLYEMLAGRQPFHADDPVAVRDAILTGVYRPLRETAPTVPPPLDRIVTRCMATDPGQRPQTAEEVADYLDRFLHLAAPQRAYRRWGLGILLIAGVTASALILRSWPSTGRPTGLQESPAEPPTEVSVGSQPPRVFGGSAEGGKVFLGHTGRVSSLAFRAGSTWVASGGADGTVRLWGVGQPDPASGHLILRHPAAVTAVAYQPGHAVIAAGCENGRVSLWDVAAPEPKEARVLAGHAAPITKITFSPDEQTLFSGDATGVVRVHDLTRSPPGAAALPKETGRVCDIVAHGDGPRVVIAVADGNGSPAGLHFWELGKDGPKRVIHDRGRGVLKQATGVGAMAVSADGGTILAATGSVVACWSGREKPSAIGFAGVFEGHAGRVSALAVSADGRRAVSAGDDKTVHWWDATTRRSIRSFAGHPTAVTAVALSGDRPEAVSGGEDGSIRLWRLPD
jgi:WD40 repeat protein